MKCTKCSRVVRPIVALDIDGTLGDYHRHLTDFARGYFGFPLPEIPWDGGGNLEDYWRVSQEKYREVKLAFRQGGMKRTMPAYEHASGLTYNLRDAGAEIWITTTRPWLRLDSVDPDTREWLLRNGIYYDHLLYNDDKYRQLATLVDPARVVAILEDLPEQWKMAAQVFSPEVPILRRNFHNVLSTISPVVNDLVQAATMIYIRIEEWNGKHSQPEDC